MYNHNMLDCDYDGLIDDLFNEKINDTFSQKIINKPYNSLNYEEKIIITMC